MTVATAAGPVRSPFKGLTPFDDSELDALLFFGRQHETEIVVANALASRLTVLYGPSGVGKSSLLRAGVAQSLRRIGETEPVAVAVFGGWSGAPLAGIEEAARAGVADALGADPGDAPGSTADRLDAWTAALGGELCLVLDQLEEFFLYHGDAPEGREFAEQLADLVTRPRLRVNVLLGIRDDALARLDAFKSQIPGLFANALRLDRLDREAARTAVLGPLGRYNELAEPDRQVSIEPALVEAVLAEVAAGRIDTGLAGRGGVEGGGDEQRIEAPYLQLVLQRLWEVERERGSGILRLATFRELGGAERIVEDHLERAMGALTALQRDVAAGMFDHLVTPSGTKIAHGVADLATYARVREDDLAPVVLALAGQRILRPLGEDGERIGDRYEIFHDVLAGAVLAWRLRHDADSALRREREAARRRQRRLGAIALLALLGLALMAALTVYAFSQRSEAREQTVRAQAASRQAVAAAATAKQERDRANREAATATAAKRDADASRAAAERSARQSDRDAERAEASEADAKASEARATGLAGALEDERDNAVRLQGEAEQAAADATEAKRDAQAEATRAERSEREALAARAATQRSLKAARAQALTARALSLLASDPEESLSLVVHAAKLASTRELERATRGALLYSRVRMIAPAGPGAAVAAETSADGTLLLAAGGGGEARVYRTRTGKRVVRVRHGETLTAAALAPDGRTIATAGGGSIRIWSVATGAGLLRLAHAGSIRELAYSPDSALLAAAASDRLALVWSARDGRVLHRFLHARAVASVAFGAGGGMLLTVDGNAHLRDVATGAPVGASLDQPGDIRAAAFSPDGAFVATGGRDNRAFIWDARTGARLRELTGHGEDVLSVAWSPNGQFVATGSADSGARVFRADIGGNAVTTLARQTNHIVSVAFAPDSAALVAGSLDGTAWLWSGPVFTRGAQLLGHAGAVTRVGFTADARNALTAGEDGSVRLWIRRADPELVGRARHDAPARAVAYSANGLLLVTAGLDRTAVIRRRNGSPLRTLAHPAAVADAAFSPDGRVLLTGGEDGVARLWRVADGRLLQRRTHGAPIYGVAFDPRGRRIATAGADGIAVLWLLGAAGPERLLRHGGGPLGRIGFSPDGRKVGTAGSDGDGRIWRTSDGRLLSVLVGHEEPVTSIAFSPDGRLVVTGSADADVRLWGAARGTPQRVLRGHSSTVSQAVFSTDGRWIATAGPNTIGLWEIGTGRRLESGGPLLLLRGDPRRVRAVAVSPSGRIASVGDDGSLRTYDCEICGRLRSLARLAERRLANLARTLTPAERQRYLGLR